MKKVNKVAEVTVMKLANGLYIHTLNYKKSYKNGFSMDKFHDSFTGM